MKIELCDYNEETGVMTIDTDEEGKEFLIAEGVAYTLLKGLHNMNDKDALDAFKSYAELHLKVDCPIEDVPDEWAYWTPEHVNETTKSEHDKADLLREWEIFVKEGRIK